MGWFVVPQAKARRGRSGYKDRREFRRAIATETGPDHQDLEAAEACQSGVQVAWSPGAKRRRDWIDDPATAWRANNPEQQRTLAAV